MAGLVTAAVAADLPVQMLTATYDQFAKWFFFYQTVTEIEVLIILALILIYKPYFPFVMSMIWSHLPVVGVMTRVRNIVPLGGFTLRNGMYRREWRDNIMYYVKKYLGSFFFMGVPFDIVHIDRGFVIDPIMNKYVSSLAGMGYHNVQDIDNAITFNNIDKDGEDYVKDDGTPHNTTTEIVANMGFDSYESARKALNPSGLTPTSFIYAPKFSVIPLDAHLNYGSDVGPGSIAAQIDDIFEYRKPPFEEDKWFKLLPYIILLFVIGLSAAMIISQVK